MLQETWSCWIHNGNLKINQREEWKQRKLTVVFVWSSVVWLLRNWILKKLVFKQLRNQIGAKECLSWDYQLGYMLHHFISSSSTVLFCAWS